jgi:hypothetical protein
VRKGLLASVVGKKKVVGYKLGPQWPPVEFFKSGPVGFVSVIQLWFRYYVKNHISQQSSARWRRPLYARTQSRIWFTSQILRRSGFLGPSLNIGPSNLCL